MSVYLVVIVYDNYREYAFVKYIGPPNKLPSLGHAVMLNPYITACIPEVTDIVWTDCGTGNVLVSLERMPTSVINNKQVFLRDWKPYKTLCEDEVPPKYNRIVHYV